MKNSNDTILNRTSYFPICSTTPYPLCYRGPLATNSVDTILEAPDPEKWQIHNIELRNLKTQMAIDCSVSAVFLVSSNSNISATEANIYTLMTHRLQSKILCSKVTNNLLSN